MEEKEPIEVIGAGFVLGIPGIWANHTIPASLPDPEPAPEEIPQPAPPSPELPQEEQPQEQPPAAPIETTGD